MKFTALITQLMQAAGYDKSATEQVMAILASNHRDRMDCQVTCTVPIFDTTCEYNASQTPDGVVINIYF